MFQRIFGFSWASILKQTTKRNKKFNMFFININLVKQPYNKEVTITIPKQQY